MLLGPVMLDLAGTSVTDQEFDLLNHPNTGGVILFARNFTSISQLHELVAQIKSVRSPGLLVAVDQEGGRVQRFRHDFISLPAVRQLGVIYDADRDNAFRLADITGWLMATEIRSAGIDFSFAPVLDLDYGLSAVIGDRAFHAHPEAVAELARHYILGMARAGMAATGKHFPGHGAVREDSHEELPVDGRQLNEIMQRDIIPFERLIQHGLAGIMPAHVIYSQADGEPAGYSQFWLQEVLRSKLGFEGVIFSDDLTMSAAGIAGGYPARATRALEAGCDIVLVCNNIKGAQEVLQGLGDYKNSESQARLLKMQGQNRQDYADVRESPAWHQAVAEVQDYSLSQVDRA